MGRKAGAVTGDGQTASCRVKDRDRERPSEVAMGSQTGRGCRGRPGESEDIWEWPRRAREGLFRTAAGWRPSPPASRCRVLRLRSRCSSTRVASADFCSLDMNFSTSSNTWFRMSWGPGHGDAWDP